MAYGIWPMGRGTQWSFSIAISHKLLGFTWD